MKTDRYKDWEYKFFEGEELTPEEELFLKNESDNPYFSFLKEEKEEKMDLSFEDFLKKTEAPEPAVIPLVKKNFYKQYWMAASLVLLMGIGGFWMFNQPENTKPVLAKNNIKPKQNQPAKIENQNQKITDDQPVFANKEDSEKPILKIENSEVKSEKEILISGKNPEQNHFASDENIHISDSGYNPNYVIINGKPVYDEKEAIAVAEDAFNYFASNVTQTINQAETAQNVSQDLTQIINF